MSARDRTADRKILVVQHGADDPPGRLGRWLVEGGCEVAVVRCHLQEPLPSTLTGYAGLVVLGGAMGAYDDADFPWLTATKTLLAAAVDADLPTLAVCLGHQLLAVANGGRVERHWVQQVGVTAVRPTLAAGEDPLFRDLAAGSSALHWNHDLVVEPPPGAVPLSYSDAGLQAFRLGTRVWGVQFHPEVDVETVADWARSEVATGEVDVQRAAAGVAALAEADAELQVIWRGFAHRFAEHVHAQGGELRNR